VIAYALLRLAARTHKVVHPILRFTDLVRAFLLERRDIAAIERPPRTNPRHKIERSSPNQMSFSYA
jgi:putative transposase